MGQDAGVVGILLALGDQALATRGHKIGFHLVGRRGIIEAAGKGFHAAIPVIRLPEQQAPGSGGDPAASKIGDDFFAEKAFKSELVRADSIPRYPGLELFY